MSLNPRIVKESFALIEPQREKAAAYFYGRLFAENPRLRALFPPAMDMQRDRLFQALTKIAWSVDSPETLATYIDQLGRDHRKFGVRREHYQAVGQALIATLRRFCGDSWNAEMQAAWVATYNDAAQRMMQAAEESSATAPPWWIAEVLDHERRGHDLAVITLRPNHRLDYEAGQHVTVQTARWPRVWRPYSIANAPRADGVLRLHVRAVPGGWVSGALVRHTKVGDNLMLGSALGTMTLDPESDRDLLLVAGGTGLAPLKAMAEQVVMAGRPRNVHLLFGARDRSELYDLDDLRLLESTYPWLRVVPVVSDDPGYDGMHGVVSDALQRFPDWDDHEIYLAGPQEMINATIAELQRLGVGTTRVRHDVSDHFDRL